jgi:hypothetical protein
MKPRGSALTIAASADGGIDMRAVQSIGSWGGGTKGLGGSGGFAFSSNSATRAFSAAISSACLFGFMTDVLALSAVIDSED